MIGAGFEGIGGKQVSGDLFAHELGVGLVPVEGVDDIVAVAPGVGEDERASAAAGFGESGDVQPVSAPTLAEVRGAEEVVDDLLEGVGGLVVQEGVGLP